MTKDEALRLALEALEDETNEKYCPAITAIKAALEAKDEPVGKLQKPTGERAWFTISELNAWADKKLSENPHWVMPKDEPERDDPPPQRTWVGLTDDEITQEVGDSQGLRDIIRNIEHKLKEKNNG
jgi:hypothetical protein